MTQSSGGPITQCLTSCSQASNPSLCQSCNPQCVGCLGPSNKECVECREASIVLDSVTTCVPQCGSTLYLARVSSTSSEHECLPCHSQCQSCTGEGSTSCLQCVGVNSTISGVSTCLTNCLADMYESSNQLCQDCHMQCSGGCRGPTNRNCSACLQNSIAIGTGIVECIPSCAFGMVYNSNSGTCILAM